MKDSAEQALILYFSFVMLTMIIGVVTIGILKRTGLKAIGLLLILTGIFAAIYYDDALQWSYERGLFAYLP